MSLEDIDSPNYREATFKVGVVQQRCGESMAENLGTAVDAIRACAEEGAQIVCLPELFQTVYFCSKEDYSWFERAEPIPGNTTETLREVARSNSVVVIAPIFERRGPGVYHNSAVVIDADGSLRGIYRKMHIPDDPLFYEKFYFTPGDAEGRKNGFQVFHTKYATIGVLICWDQWFPEAARITSLMGAEVLFYPTAIGWHPREKPMFGEQQRDAWRTVQRGHAIANGVYVAVANRIGHEKTPGTEGIEFFGSSFVSDPFGRVIAEAGLAEPANLIVKCSRREIEEVRQHWPFLRDRRVDAYAPIMSRFLG